MIMRNTHHSPRFTACGRSINKLRNDAKSLKKQLGITLRQSLDKIASDIKYSNWDELINQKPDARRDKYFKGMYDTRETQIMSSMYMQFLSKKSLPDNSDNYREFICIQWSISQKILGTPAELTSGLPINAQNFLNNLIQLYASQGAKSLLPQNMTNQMLEASVIGARIYNRKFEDINGDVSDECKKIFMDSVMLCVHSIMSHQSNNNHDFSVNEYHKNIIAYYRLCDLEWLSRSTRVKFELPTIDTIFTKDAMLKLTVPPGTPHHSEWYK